MLALAIICFAAVVPALAVAFRRLHDVDKSAWWLLIALIPILGAIILIVWAAKRGTAGPNRFGEDPLDGVAPRVDPLVN